MKIYTKTGDKGTTSLYDGSPVQKYDTILEVLGTLDELTSNIGVVIALITVSKIDTKYNEDIIARLRTTQKNIQFINSYIATPDVKKRNNLKKIQIDDVKNLENWIDDMEDYNSRLTAFILPGVTLEDAHIHVSRTICRKAERELCKISCDNTDVMCYINRLSDFLFSLARYVCKLNGKEDVKI